MGLISSFLSGLLILSGWGGSAGRALAATPAPVVQKNPIAPPTATKATPQPAGSFFSCSDLRRAVLRVSAHASNLANRNTTRTPSGGAFKRLDVSCAINGAFCNVEAHDDTKSVYQPGHPDADTSGYVKMPNINPGVEWGSLNSAAAELKLIALQSVCGAKAMEQGNLLIIKYNSDFEVISDTIQFKSDGKVDSWTRMNREGKLQSFAFKDDGLPIGY